MRNTSTNIPTSIPLLSLIVDGIYIQYSHRNYTKQQHTPHHPLARSKLTNQGHSSNISKKLDETILIELIKLGLGFFYNRRLV